MRNLFFSFIGISVFFISASLTAIAGVEDPTIASIFNEYKAEGTLILLEPRKNITFIHNQPRAKQPYMPGCSFQIVNYIIALQEGIVQDKKHAFHWDGTRHFMDAWNQEHDLKSAFRTSCVWCFKELAHAIGKERYHTYFQTLNYAPNTPLDAIDIENIGHSMAVSAQDQIDFLTRLYKKELPISERTYTILKDIMLEEDDDDYKVYAKTGGVTKDWVGHGWYVGYIETNNDAWLFALNMDINEIPDLAKRKHIVMDTLRAKKII